MDDAAARLMEENERLRAEIARLRAGPRGDAALAADLARAIEGLPLLLFLFDAEDRFVDYRAGRPADLYAAPESFVGKRIDAVLPDGLGARFREVMAGVRATGEERLEEYGLEMPSGRQEFEARIVPLAASRVAMLVTDLTERRRRDERLRESEERFRLAFENAPIGMALVGLDERILDANAALCAILGHPRERLVRMTVPEITHPEDLAPEAAAKEPLLHGRGASFRLQKRYLRADGGVVWGELSVSAVNGPDGRPRYYIGELEDVTEQRRLEERFEHSQRLESVGRLAGGVAHDFNNVLTVILGCGEELEADLAAGRARAEDVREILAAARRARDLTKQLLAFARRQVFAPVALDLNALVRDSQKLLARVVGEDVAVEVRLAPDLWSVRCDPAQVQQVLVNLVVNARDAMPRGGTLTLETANVAVGAAEAAADPEATPGPHVLLAVRDTGEGMTDDALAHVFEPFFTTKPAGRGTGLGLATVYGIVRQSGGHVRVRTERGRGTAFEIHLPRAAEGPAPAPRPDARTPAPATGGPETLLVVEDDPSVREVTVRALRGAGYHVLEAAEGRAALAAAAAAEPRVALLVTDVVMPGMSGRELVEALRARQPHLRALYVSGYAEDTIVHHGVLDAGVELLSKPFTPSALLARVREILDAK